MDSELLAAMFDYIAEQDAEVHSVLVVRNGYMVVEAYFHPYRQDRKHYTYSCTKSFLSALVGIAIEEGYLDLDDKVLDFFPDRVVANDDPRKRAMMVEHLLLMRSGLDWPESSVPYSSSDNILWQMMDSRDWVQFVLDRPMAVEPGTTFNYSTGDPQLLTAVLEEATGMSTQRFARTRLFEPLGVSSDHWYWQSAPEGVAFGGGGLGITPRAMAKFGYLYLEGGAWNGRQVVPAGWTEASVADPCYGYQWWLLDNGGYAALGYKGQRIAVMPNLEMVVVITGDFSGTASRYVVDAFIIPAAKSSEPLPENPEGLALLESRIGEVGSPDDD
jgi:CubicO group peptidase (beta-lactamase class C family)